MTPTATIERPIDAREAAARLGCSRKTVYELVRAGRLQPFRLSPAGRLRFEPGEVEDFIARSRRGGTAADEAEAVEAVEPAPAARQALTAAARRGQPDERRHR